MAVVDGDGGVGARFEIGSVSGDQGSGLGELDEVEVGGTESRDDPSFGFRS